MASTNFKEHLSQFLRTPVKYSFERDKFSIWICNEEIKTSFKDISKIPDNPKPNGFIDDIFDDCITIQTSLHSRVIIPFTSIAFVSEYYYHAYWEDLVEKKKKL